MLNKIRFLGGLSLNGIVVFLAVMAFLAAIIVPGAVRAQSHARAVAAMQRLRADDGADRLASDTQSDSDVVLLLAPAQ